MGQNFSHAQGFDLLCKGTALGIIRAMFPVAPRSVVQLALAGLFGLLAAPTFLLAQAPAPTPRPARPLLSNPGFESSSRRENPWDAINRQGFFEVNRGSLPVLTQSGTIADTSMPVSVSLGDLNGDGRTDILVADVIGYMWVYFNSGTPQQPKFTRGELLPLFFSRPRNATDGVVRFRGPRVHLADITRTGKLDIWMGNYIGEIFRIPNAGSGAAPDFRQPLDVTRLLIPTTSQPRRWGNVFAPAIWDFDNDGRGDLLVGEGSYSANSIHILLNQGSNAAPKFSDTNRHFLAFGMGREQLTPAVVDWDNDGKPDLLVTDRSGKIGLYSRTVETEGEAEQDAEQSLAANIDKNAHWKPGENLHFVKYLTTKSGQEMSFGGIPTVATGDLNGDGLFDIVVGKSNGRVAMILNSGTKGDPRFEAPIELKGDNSEGLETPSGWELEYGLSKGNFFGIATVVSSDDDPNLAPPEGKKALRLGYAKNNNVIIRSPFVWSGAVGSYQVSEGDPFRETSPSNTFGVRQRDRRLQNGQSYILSFKVKGTRVSNGRVDITWSGRREITEGRVVRNERGSATRVGQQIAQENKRETQSMSPGGNWSTVTKEFKVGFDNKDLAELKDVAVTITVVFDLAPGAGEIFLDDFSLVEK